MLLSQGYKTAVFQVGCTLGGTIFAPLGGHLQKNADPMWIWYLNLVCTAGQLISFVLLDLVFSRRQNKATKRNAETDKVGLLVQYNELTSQDNTESDVELDVDAFKEADA